MPLPSVGKLARDNENKDIPEKLAGQAGHKRHQRPCPQWETVIDAMQSGNNTEPRENEMRRKEAYIGIFKDVEHVIGSVGGVKVIRTDQMTKTLPVGDKYEMSLQQAETTSQV